MRQRITIPIRITTIVIQSMITISIVLIILLSSTCIGVTAFLVNNHNSKLPNQYNNINYDNCRYIAFTNIIETPFQFPRKEDFTKTFKRIQSRQSSSNTIRLFVVRDNKNNNNMQDDNEVDTNNIINNDNNNNNTPSEEEEIQRWESMYYQNNINKDPFMKAQLLDNDDDDGNDDKSSSETIRQTPIKVITFDLDDTIWRTGITINDANDALRSFMVQQYQQKQQSNNKSSNKSKNITTEEIVRVDKIMKQLFQSNPMRYNPNMIHTNMIHTNDTTTTSTTSNTSSTITTATTTTTTKSDNQPILLTLLRKDAIRHVLLSMNDDTINTDVKSETEAEATETEATETKTQQEIEHVVNEAFDVWMNARITSIEKKNSNINNNTNNNYCYNNLAYKAIETLQTLKERYSTSILIGAITDGNSNPMTIDLFQGIFDFCVNAEIVGVAKPNKKVFLYAAEQHILPYINKQQQQQQEGSSTSSNDNDNNISISNNKNDIETQIGPWWVHIGDNFVKDIVGAKSLNIRTIWCRELLSTIESPWQVQQQQSQQQQSASDNDSNKNVNDDTIVQEFVKKVTESGNSIQMQVGSDDYLIDSIQNEFCDAIIDKFIDIIPNIDQWNSHINNYNTIDNYVAPVEQQQQQQQPISVNDDTNESSYMKVYYPNDNDDDDAKVVTSKNSIKIVQTDTSTITTTTAPPTSSFKFCIDCGTKLPIQAKFCSSCGMKQEIE